MTVTYKSVDELKHAMQPVGTDKDGVLRFKENAIVSHLVDTYPGGLNQIARLHISSEDYTQLMQLIGYSVAGFQELSSTSDQRWYQAEALRENPGLDERDSTIAALELQLKNKTEWLRNFYSALMTDATTEEFGDL